MLWQGLRYIYSRNLDSKNVKKENYQCGPIFGATIEPPTNNGTTGVLRFKANFFVQLTSPRGKAVGLQDGGYGNFDIAKVP